MLYFSIGSRSFYDDRIHCTWPADAVPITAAEHQALLAGLNAGMSVALDAEGHPVATDTSSLPIRREGCWRRLEADMHHYIFVTNGYPQPSQITLQAIYADPSSAEAQRAAVRAIFDWVRGCVLAHYYGKKAEILASDIPENVAWNFSAACDSAAPGYTLAQIMQLA